jgi:Domain of Unknown Function (DUF1080)
VKSIALLLAGLGLQQAAVAQVPRIPADAPRDTWLPLFNGENLDGWVAKFAGSPVGENYRNTFRVEDGMLVVSYDDWDEFRGEFGHLFFDQPFSHYVLRAEYRFVGEQVRNGPDWGRLNNGFMLHSEAPAGMTLEQQFPVSIELKLYAAEGGISGNVCTPGTDVRIGGAYTHGHCIDTTVVSHGADEWVIVEAEVHGHDRIVHRLNGVVTAEYTAPILDVNDPGGERVSAARLIAAGAPVELGSGYIAIQAETQPVQFRRIEIQLLDE